MDMEHAEPEVERLAGLVRKLTPAQRKALKRRMEEDEAREFRVENAEEEAPNQSAEARAAWARIQEMRKEIVARGGGMSREQIIRDLRSLRGEEYEP